jgi:hypothetical protein
MIYLGVFLSSIGIVATLFTFTFFRFIKFSLFKSNCDKPTWENFQRSERHGIVHRCLMILAVCLLATNVLYVVNSFLTLKNCVFISALLHYFTLTSFMQLLSISSSQYITLTKIFDYKIHKFFLKSLLFTFGMPLFIPIILLSLEPRIYENKTRAQCWLNGPTLYVLYISRLDLFYKF